MFNFVVTMLIVHLILPHLLPMYPYIIIFFCDDNSKMNEMKVWTLLYHNNHSNHAVWSGVGPRIPPTGGQVPRRGHATRSLDKGDMLPKDAERKLFLASVYKTLNIWCFYWRKFKNRDFYWSKFKTFGFLLNNIWKFGSFIWKIVKFGFFIKESAHPKSKYKQIVRATVCRQNNIRINRLRLPDEIKKIARGGSLRLQGACPLPPLAPPLIMISLFPVLRLILISSVR